MSLFFLMLNFNGFAQGNDGLIYNFNKQINRIGAELKASQVSECYVNLISINNVVSNYLIKKEVPNSLLDFLINKKVFCPAFRTKGSNEKVFLVARYIHSTQYDSYLILVISEDSSRKNLYLVNVTSDTLISFCLIASCSQEIGLNMQRYSIYQGNDLFEMYFEEIISDIELVQEEDKVREKQQRVFKIPIVVDSDTGKIYRK